MYYIVLCIYIKCPVSEQWAFMCNFSPEIHLAEEVAAAILDCSDDEEWLQIPFNVRKHQRHYSEKAELPSVSEKYVSGTFQKAEIRRPLCQY